MHHCKVASALQIPVRTFRVHHALKIVISKLNKEGDARPNDAVVTDEIVTFFNRMRPGIQPAYTRKIVEEELHTGRLYGLVRARNLQLTGCGAKLVEMTLDNTDAQLDPYREWYSSGKVPAAA